MPVAIAVEVDHEALEAECEQLLMLFELAVYRSLDVAAERTAAQARAAHWYRNRTGALEASTQPRNSVGDVWSDGAFSQAVADTEYASYVHDRGAFLEDAWRSVEGAVTTEISSILEAATR